MDGHGTPQFPLEANSACLSPELGPIRSALGFTRAGLRKAACWGCDGDRRYGSTYRQSLSPLPSAAQHLAGDLDPPTETLQTHVYQQTEETKAPWGLGGRSPRRGRDKLGNLPRF